MDIESHSESEVATLGNFLVQSFELEPDKVRAVLSEAAVAALSACEVVSDFVRKLVSPAITFVERLDALPELPGHEELLTKRFNGNRDVARIFVALIHGLGSQLAAERNDGRKIATAVRWLATASTAGTLAVSRRASNLLALLRGRRDWAGSTASRARIERLLERASRREVTACEFLVRMSRRSVPLLSSPLGRPLAEVTCIHAVLLLILQKFGGRTYTYSFMKNKYVDEVTLATRRARAEYGNFQPTYAAKLMNQSFAGLALRHRGQHKRRLCDAADSR